MLLGGRSTSPLGVKGVAQSMLSATCHCGSVRIHVRRAPRTVTHCNCSICRRYGALWYQPGWQWSKHVGPDLGLARCSVEHVGLVLAGVATAAFDDGTVIELKSGQLFYIPPVPHDSWVVGDEPYVSLHFLGADKYARA